MAGTLTNLKVTTSEKGIKVTQQGDRGPNREVSVGPSGLSGEITAGPVSLSIGQDGTIGGKIGIGGLSVGADNKGGFTVETPLGGIDYNSDGSGTIKAPFGIAKVEVEKKGCTYILRTYITGALIDTEVREIPDCQEPPTPPLPEPPPSPKSFNPFDPGSLPYNDDEIGIASLSWRKTQSSIDGRSFEQITNTNIIPNQPYRENLSHYRVEYINYGGLGNYYDLTITTLFSGSIQATQTGTIWLPAYEGQPGRFETNSSNSTIPINPGVLDFTPLKFFFRRIRNWVDDWSIATPQTLYDYNKLPPGKLWETDNNIWIYGNWKRIKEYIVYSQYAVTGLLSNQTNECIGVEFFTDRPKPVPYIGGGIEMSNCCKESKVDLARLEEKLDMLLQVTEAENLTKIGYSIPASLIAFGADAKSKLKIQSIPGYLNFIMREIDHYGISPIKINIKDIDPTQEGDQSLSEQYINGTAAIKRILELLHGQKGTDKLRLNLQARIASMLDMVLASVTAINELLESITVYIDMPLKEKIEKYKQPWDPYIGLKGFSQKQAWEKELNKKLKEDMEKNIADMCNDSERSVVVQKFNGKADRLVQLIQKLLIGMKNG